MAASSSTSTPPKKFGVVLFPGFQALDVFGPLDILNLLSKYTPQLELYILSKTLYPVPTKAYVKGFEMSQSVVPTHTFDNAPDDIEVLLVPGGFGTRQPDLVESAVDFVKSAFPKLRYLLTVCTGSALVAMTGLLDGKRATSNKRAFSWAMAQGPNVQWVREARAGIDMTYAFVSEHYGEDLAQEIADRAEYTRQKDSTVDPYAELPEASRLNGERD
ncbi:putative family protein [Eutypa lata UCREL1]|uniref:Putative family protein n=1 Tax=Eutypa lata (strain UCR-EL1) TaxID=1287681 RepID=M7TFR8_EUTLA|nr:putative family protein [Eutypa lata UCREL1]